MSQSTIHRKVVWVLAVGCVGLFVVGCGPSQEVRVLRMDNQRLTYRVQELEDQLEQASMEYYAATSAGQTNLSERTYLIVQGDSLWGIAQKQLGSGNRYKEILALNSQLSVDKPLTIGTKITLPNK